MSFGIFEMEYLSHIIFGQGVSVDPRKISAMQTWRSPKNVKAFREFLGITRYYRKFIRHYGQIAAPLIALLKKKGFCVVHSG